MPEPLKNLFDLTLIQQMAEHLSSVNRQFDRARFLAEATDGLEVLELKQRSAQICRALQMALPDKYRHAAATLLAALHPETEGSISDTSMERPDGSGIAGLRGWAIMPMADVVAKRGLEDFDFSLGVLKEMTKRFTAETAVRSFYLADHERTLAHARRWASDYNYHVRRLASEGARPRLPWTPQLPMFIADPSPLLPILEALRDDAQEYVRRSAANCLNDIAKDHPDLVADIAARWLKAASGDRRRLVKHACRSLIKQGHRPTLRAFGYRDPAVRIDEFEIKTPRVALGTRLDFTLGLTSTSANPQPLIIDYVIHHRKANGRTTPKVFKWKTADLGPGARLDVRKSHPIKPITTRTYYAGRHHLEIQINGRSVGRADFELEV